MSKKALAGSVTLLAMPIAGIVAMIGLLIAPTSNGGSTINQFREPVACSDCQVCGLVSTKHKNVYSATGAVQGLHDCVEVECAHPACGEALGAGPFPVDLLEDAERGSMEAINRLFERFPAKIHVNVARSAIQLEGCRPEVVVAHIPLNRVQLAVAVAAAEKNTAARDALAEYGALAREAIERK